MHLRLPAVVSMDLSWHTVLFLHALIMRLHRRLLRPAVAVWWILSTLLRFEKV